MSAEKALSIIKQHPNGIWIRELARKTKVSPATICNYIYGYKNNKGTYILPVLKKEIQIQKMGNSSLTLIKPKS